MKRCSLCKFESEDERGFSQHMSDVHAWGKVRTVVPAPTARRPERKRVEYDSRPKLERERSAMVSAGWSPETEAEVGVSGKVEVEWVRGLPISVTRQEYVAKGYNGQLIVRERTIVINRKAVVGFLSHPTSGEKEIQIGSIHAVQVKKPGLTVGFIQFSVSGGVESRRGVMDATRDENTVTFRSNYEAFAKAKQLVEQRMAELRAPSRAPEASAMDELAKLAELHRNGVVTDEEFAQKKKQLLGL
jgi:hypothetical protein